MAGERPSAMKQTTSHWAATLQHALLCMILFHSAAAAASEHETDPLNEEAVRHAFYLGLKDRRGMTSYGGFAFHSFGRNVFMVGSDKNGLVREELTCLLCTPEETLSAARSFGASIQAKASGQKPSMLNIDTALDGPVAVDGVPVAPLSGSHAIEPGEHEIAVTTGGKSRYARISMAPDEKIDISRVDAAAPDESKILRVRWAVASSGTGIALAAVGGVLLGLYAKCGPTNETCAYTYKDQSKRTGIGLIAAGAILQGIMVWLLLPRRAGEEQ